MKIICVVYIIDDEYLRYYFYGGDSFQEKEPYARGF
jgi:hypothetical protein